MRKLIKMKTRKNDAVLYRIRRYPFTQRRAVKQNNIAFSKQTLLGSHALKLQLWDCQF